MLSDAQKNRYSRHLMLEDIGEVGQEKLLKSSVLIIGAGALGTPNAIYLSGAGIGRIGIVDDDVVDFSNLHRQILYTSNDVGKQKALCAKERMLAINPDIRVDTHITRFEMDNALDLVRDYDFIIDATDNFVSKFLVNDACVIAKKPYAHAGIVRYMGQCMTITPQSACLSCVFEAPPTDSSIYKPGLIGTLTGILGSIQATEAIKWILGLGESLENSMINVDIKSMSMRKIKVKHNKECKVCGKDGIKELRTYSCN